jgi:hypothetical protein
VDRFVVSNPQLTIPPSLSAPLVSNIANYFKIVYMVSEKEITMQFVKQILLIPSNVSCKSKDRTEDRKVHLLFHLMIRFLQVSL